MQWLWVAIFSLIVVSLTGFSIKTVFIYIIFSGLTAWLVRQFLIKNCEFDFEVIFNLFEWFGYGTPHRIDRVKVTFNPDDGVHTLTQIPRPIRRSLDRIISHILRDFVATWYDNVAKGSSFKEEAKRLLQMLSVEIYKRACDCDIQHLIEQVIYVFHVHLKRYNNSVAVVKGRNTNLKLTISAAQLLSSTYVSQVKRRHVVLVNPSLELSYLRVVIDTMLVLLIKNDEYKCNVGRFMLREVLTVQTFKPLVDLMTDPDWISEALIAVLEDSPTSVTQPGHDIEDSPLSVTLPAHDIEDSPTGVLLPGHDIEDSPTGVALPGHDIEDFPTGVLLPGHDTEDSPTGFSLPGHDIEDSPTGVALPGHNESEDPPPLPSNSFDTSLQNLKYSLTDINDIGKEKEEDIGFENYLTEGSQDLLQDGKTNKNQIEANENINNSEVSKSFASCSGSLDKDSLGEVYTTVERANSIVSSHLSSSWSVVPNSRDNFFQAKSYEKLRDRQNKAQSGNLNELKRLGTCCLKFETSSDFNTDDATNDKTITEDHSASRSLKSGSFRKCQSASCAENFTDSEISRKSTLRQSLSRSLSVPSSLSSYKVTGRSLSIPDNGQIFENGSPFYSISIQSESDTYITASSDEDFDEVEEVDETTFLDDDCDDDSDFDVFVAADVPGISNQSCTGHVQLQKQSSFEEDMQFNAKALPIDLQGINRLPSADNQNGQGTCLLAGSQNGFDNSDFSVTRGKFYDGDYEKRFGKSQLHKFSKTSQSSNSTGTSSRDSDSFLGDTLTSAKENWKKLVSSISPPSVKFQFGDSKRGEEKQLTRNNGNEGHLEPFSSDKSKRSISRSDALIDSDSDSEGSVGNRINYDVYQHVCGGHGSVDNGTLYAVDKGLFKIHPSCLISIPTTELLSEIDDRGPGRNKFTVYHIEYDVHIWPDVYHLAVYESSGRDEGAEGKSNGDSSEHQDEVECKQEKKAKNLDCKRVIKRRYREFMELHNRLMHSEHCKEMKAILKPNRKFNMPFGRLEPSVIEGRRTILQYYLVSLVSNPSLRESQELREFLGVTGDGLVSFVKPSVAQMVSQSVYVPRVDKMLNRQMTKLIDKVKTAFDAVDEEEDSPTRGQPLDKTFLTNSCVSMPWNLSCPEQQLEEDGALSIHTESCFDVFIDCQDFEIDDVSSTPTQLNHRDRSPILSDQQEKKYDFPQLARLEIDDRKEHSERQSQGDTPNEEPLMEEVPHFSSSSRLYRNEKQLDPTPTEAENGVRKRPLGASVSLPSSRSPSLDKLSLPKVPKGRVSPTTVKEKLTSFANKGDDMWDGIKDNLTKRHSPRDRWELVGDNVRRVKNHSSCQELLSKPKEVDEVTEKYKTKQLFGWNNIKSNLIPKLKQDEAPGKPSNFNLKQILKDRKKKKQDDNHSPDNESTKNLVSNKTSRTDEFTLDHVIRPSPVKDDPPLTSSPIDHPSQYPTGLTESVVNDDPQCPLANSILQLLCEVFRGYNSWVCLDYVQRAFMGVFGGIFEWWLQGELDELVTEQKWGYYLKLFDEAIWPSGQLKDKQPEKAEEDKMKTKKKAIKTLMEFFPGLFALSVGQKTYEECAENIVESLQYPEINRILLFELLELLLVEICPELQVQNSEIETV